MPKMKTRKSAAKRFEITKKGKAKRAKSTFNHKLEKKAPDRKRGNSKTTGVSNADVKNVKEMIGA
ncbi:MAG: 50S ribosomal protein L35 [bacterium]|nr:50S ribosomal protein L35 [bacterium]